MKNVTEEDIKDLYIPPSDSHKGQNGRMLIIGGSHLLHAASLWSLTIASRIVDLVHYASVPENNEIVQKAKEEFRNGIVIHRDQIDDYIQEDDVILIGPGMTRDAETETLTNTLLQKYPHKQWVIDAGALQMLALPAMPQRAILTPHQGEWEGLLEKFRIQNSEFRIEEFAKAYQCIVLVKGQEDIACNGATGESWKITGGNAGMTKGGTGDVLAGLIAALACKNDPMKATLAGSFINKAAGDSLFETVGVYFNATDLANEIPKVMKKMMSTGLKTG